MMLRNWGQNYCRLLLIVDLSDWNQLEVLDQVNCEHQSTEYCSKLCQRFQTSQIRNNKVCCWKTFLYMLDLTGDQTDLAGDMGTMMASRTGLDNSSSFQLVAKRSLIHSGVLTIWGQLKFDEWIPGLCTSGTYRWLITLITVNLSLCLNSSNKVDYDYFSLPLIARLDDRWFVIKSNL